MRRLTVAALVVAGSAGGVALAWDARTSDGRGSPQVEGPAAWAGLDPQDRCDNASVLVTHPDRWPLRCRWRNQGETLSGQAFPPPRGAPPYEDPHVEIFVDPAQSREQLASAIAHELGHMHHTREPAIEADWLAARNLPAGTPPEVWTEDYAEVFATLFGPPADRWRAPTPRPSPGALADLKARFFS